MRFIATAALTILLSFQSALAASSPLSAAQKQDAALRAHPKQLRFRDNIQQVISSWERARREAKNEADRLAALQGEIAAWQLMAHWSGRSADRNRAEQLSRRLTQPKTQPARAQSGPVWLRGVKVVEHADRIELVLEHKGAFSTKRGKIPPKKGKPIRVYFDLSPMVAARGVAGTVRVRSKELSRVRVGQFNKNTVRLVMDVVHHQAINQRVEALADRIVVRLPKNRPAAVVAQKTNPKKKTKKKTNPPKEDDVAEVIRELGGALAALSKDLPGDEPIVPAPEHSEDALANIVREVKGELGESSAKPKQATSKAMTSPKEPKAIATTKEMTSPPEVKEPIPATEIAAATPEPEENDASELEPLSLEGMKRSTRAAAQPRAASLLRIRRIVIDAGHGGKDAGAAVGRVKEKHVNLAIAKKLARELKKRLGVKTILTRTNDKFVSLRRRSRIANRSRGDLFISIHANANRNRRVNGIETYYLNTTSNRYARKLARRENSQGKLKPISIEPGVGMPENEEMGSLPGGSLGRDLRLILADFAMRSATVESRRLAGYVQSSLVGTIRQKKKYSDVRDLGVKHALFYVLMGARMPSVLIETGFVTNKKEAKRLANPRYQQLLAASIATGIVRFAKERELLARRRELRGLRYAELDQRSE